MKQLESLEEDLLSKNINSWSIEIHSLNRVVDDTTNLYTCKKYYSSRFGNEMLNTRLRECVCVFVISFPG